MELIYNNTQSEENSIKGFQDGERYASHFLFSDSDKFSIQIHLFFDGMGTTNPLRGQSTTCNVVVFYYTILNLPPMLNSCFVNVHLLALCHTLDIKTHGYRPVLERFVAEINHLQTVGFSGAFPIIGSCQIYVGLAQVSCDKLALNGLFGFIECFSADHFCTICLATQTDIQTKTYESEFCIRTRDGCATDVRSVMPMSCGHSHGVKAACVLNEIRGFHVTENNAGAAVLAVVMAALFAVVMAAERTSLPRSIVNQSCRTLLLISGFHIDTAHIGKR